MLEFMSRKKTGSITSPIRCSVHKILFVGSNPSQSSASNIPFYGDTKSLDTINKWIQQLQTDGLTVSVDFINVCDFKTLNNRPLKTSEIKAALPSLRLKLDQYSSTTIITLGKTAEKAMTLLRLTHYAMPHPSGLNRKLNDSNYVAEKINGLKELLKSVQVSRPN